MASTRPRRWRRVVLWTVCIVLAAPLLVVAVYRFVPPPVTPLMLIRMVQGEELRYRWTTLEGIAPSLPELVVAAEDNGFCQHQGFDVAALREQIAASIDGERARGASTISMQLAKNLFLWPGRSFVRKGLEIWLTPYIELMLPKRRILEIYLNVVEWGPGIYGAAAAADAHFGVTAQRLAPAQAALLAAVLPNPRRWSAARPTDYIRGRAALYRQRVTQLGPAWFSCWRREK